MITQYFRENPDWALYALGFCILQTGILVELLFSFAKKRSVYNHKDLATNLAMYSGYFLILVFWAPVVFSVYMLIHQKLSLFDFGPYWLDPTSIHFWWQWGTLLVLDDLAFYFFHRSSHRYRLLWASHVNHHSSNYFNLSVGFRQTWTPFFAFVFWVPIAIIGYDPLMILSMQLLSLFYQACLHTQLISSFGPLDHILNSPSHHRVHHGKNENYLDKNFAGIFIVWDKLFGTFCPEKEGVVYGLSHDIQTHNPIKVAFHEWIAIFKSIARPHPKYFTLILMSSTLLLTGCLENLQLNRIKKHHSQIQSFSGKINQLGLLPDDAPVVAEINYKKPGSYKAIITHPDSLKGTTVNFSGSTLYYYYPSLKWAIIFENISPMNEADYSIILERSHKYNLEKFEYDLNGTKKLNGVPVVELVHTSRGSTYNRSGKTQVYDKYSFPISGDLTFRGGVDYSFEYKHFEFNQEIDDNVFSKKVPSGILKTTWDFDTKGLSNEEIVNNGGIVTPVLKSEKFDLKLIKTIRVEEGFPAFASIYRDGPFQLLLTHMKDFTGAFDSFKYGIPIKVNGTTGRLILSPYLSSFFFAKNNVVYSLSGNLPFEELLSLAEGI